MSPTRSVYSPRPSNLRAVLALLLCCLFVGGLLGCSPTDPVKKATELQAAGKGDEAIAVLRDALEENPGDSRLLFHYGRLFALRNEPSLAEWSLREAMKDPEWRAPAALLLAQTASRAGNYEEADQIASTIIESDPKNIEALSIRAQARVASRTDFEGAIADAETILELDPNYVGAMEPMILALLGLERIEEAGQAIDRLGQMIEEQALGDATRGWYCATRALFRAADAQDESVDALWDECVEEFPGHTNVVTNAVNYYQSKGDRKKAIEVLRKAVETVPTDPSFARMLAASLSVAGRNAEAIEILESRTKAEDPYAAISAWFDLMSFDMLIEDYESAAKAGDQAIAISREQGPVNPTLLFTYGDALVLAGRLDEALKIADETKVEAYAEVLRARVHQQRGDDVKALEHFEKAFLVLPNNAPSRYYAAVAAERLGDLEKAIEYYRYSVRIDPASTDARGRLARIHVAEGRPRDAVTILALGGTEHPLSPLGEMIKLRLLGFFNQRELIGDELSGLAVRTPQLIGRGIAAVGLGFEDRVGPATALPLLLGLQGFDPSDPFQADGLLEAVRMAADAGKLDEIEPKVDAALERRPDSARFHTIRGYWLERSGAPAGEARAAYDAALERDPEDAEAIAGIARLIVATDPAAALERFDRAAALRDDRPEYEHAAIDALRSLRSIGERDDDPEVRKRLEKLLERHPTNVRAAAELVELDLESAHVSPQTLSRARRVIRFRRGAAESWELLARVQAQLGDEKAASEATRRAAALREHEAGGAEPS